MAFKNNIPTILRSRTQSADARKVGIEVENLAVWPDGKPFRFQSNERPGAEDLLTQLAKEYSWTVNPNDQGQPLGLVTPYGNLTLEPGSQVELGATASRRLHELCETVDRFLESLYALTDDLGLKWLPMANNPLYAPEDIDVIPACRYHIMTHYLSKQGSLATSMMRLTTSIQVNLDYLDEKDGMEMLRVALAASPMSYALFSNSPFSKGECTDYLSFRQRIWQNTDPDRVGLLPEVFKEGFGFKDYAELIWNRPLMYTQNTFGNYLPANGASLADLASGKIPGVVPEEMNQLTAVRQLFTEARLKPGHVEVRSIDGGLSKELRNASVAFWVGILYSPKAREFVRESFGRLSQDELQKLLDLSARVGMKAELNGIAIKPLVSEAVALAEEYLISREHGEEEFLEPLKVILNEEQTPAEKLKLKLSGEFKGDIHRLVNEI